MSSRIRLRRLLPQCVLCAVLCLVATPPLMAEEQVDLEQGLAKAAALAEAGKAKEAEDAYTVLVDDLEFEWQDAAGEAGRTLIEDGGRDHADTDRLIAIATRVLKPVDAAGARLVTAYLAQAAFLVKSERLPETITALRRAVSHDLDLFESIKKDSRFKQVLEHGAMKELAGLLDHWRGGLSTDSPFEDMLWRRREMRRIRYGLEEDGFGQMLDPHTLSLHNLTVRRQNDHPRVDKVDWEEYSRMVRLGTLHPTKMYGWPYMHSSLVHGHPSTAGLYDIAITRWRESKDKETGPFYAFCAAVNGTYKGKLDVVDELLDYMKPRAQHWYQWALVALEHVVGERVKHQISLPGVSMSRMKELDERIRKAREPGSVVRARWEAWQGHQKAFYVYGRGLLFGLGVPEDAERGVMWYRYGAQFGDDSCRWGLAHCLEVGSGVEKDEERAFELYLDLAEGGWVPAYNTVAFKYQYGQGVEQDYVQAREYFELAMEADAGVWSAYAPESLALLISRGQGGEKDVERARELFLAFAEKTDPRGYWRVTQMRFDNRADDANFDELIESADTAASKSPDTHWPVVYGWAARLMKGAAKEARAYALEASKNADLTDWRRDLLVALSKRSFHPNRVLKQIMKSKEFEEDKKAFTVTLVHYIAGINALARKKPVIAQREFEAAVKDAHPGDSFAYSARFELERLKK